MLYFYSLIRIKRRKKLNSFLIILFHKNNPQIWYIIYRSSQVHNIGLLIQFFFISQLIPRVKNIKRIIGKIINIQIFPFIFLYFSGYEFRLFKKFNYFYHYYLNFLGSSGSQVKPGTL